MQIRIAIITNLRDEHITKSGGCQMCMENHPNNRHFHRSDDHTFSLSSDWFFSLNS